MNVTLSYISEPEIDLFFNLDYTILNSVFSQILCFLDKLFGIFNIHTENKCHLDEDLALYLWTSF